MSRLQTVLYKAGLYKRACEWGNEQYKKEILRKAHEKMVTLYLYGVTARITCELGAIDISPLVLLEVETNLLKWAEVNNK